MCPRVRVENFFDPQPRVQRGRVSAHTLPGEMGKETLSCESCDIKLCQGRAMICLYCDCQRNYAKLYKVQIKSKCAHCSAHVWEL